MTKRVATLAEEYSLLFSSRLWVMGAGIGIFLVLVAYVVNRFAGLRATRLSMDGHSIADVVLDSIPKFDTLYFHLGALNVLVVVAIVTMVVFPRRFPMAMFVLAATIFVRALFINMTHLGMYEDAQRIYGAGVTFGGDLFFSGHVALPFVLAMTFWNVPWARYFFFLCSFVLGVQSLLGHLHYTIDVLAAPFIAYGIYRAVARLLPRFEAMQ